jgi:pyruvyl transferase EpsO
VSNQLETFNPAAGGRMRENAASVDYQAEVDALTTVLGRLIGNRPVALLDWPFYANAGDHFIWLGEKIILKHRLGIRILFECSLRSMDFAQLARLPPEAVLVFNGGGNFGDLYSEHQRFREAVIAAFPDRRIVTMPQTMMFQSAERAARSIGNLMRHPDLHVIARDRASLAILTGLKHCYLGIDSAFALQPIVTEIASGIDALPERDVLRLLRRDGEASERPFESETSLDWAAHDDLATLLAEGPDIESIGIAQASFETNFDRVSWQRLCAAVRLFSTARRIVTDRLHGHILALMMRKEHDFYDNNYGKNSSFHHTWTEHDFLVSFIRKL